MILKIFSFKALLIFSSISALASGSDCFDPHTVADPIERLRREFSDIGHAHDRSAIHQGASTTLGLQGSSPLPRDGNTTTHLSGQYENDFVSTKDPSRQFTYHSISADLEWAHGSEDHGIVSANLQYTPFAVTEFLGKGKSFTNSGPALKSRMAFGEGANTNVTASAASIEWDQRWFITPNKSASAFLNFAASGPGLRFDRLPQGNSITSLQVAEFTPNAGIIVRSHHRINFTYTHGEDYSIAMRPSRNGGLQLIHDESQSDRGEVFFKGNTAWSLYLERDKEKFNGLSADSSINVGVTFNH